MITDDPGTPGDGHWEINLAWTEQRTPGATLDGIPLLDANYGLGDRIQLNFQASYNDARAGGEPAEDGLSDSQLAVKWRFYDAGEDTLQVSTYPRFTFVNPASDSDRRGTADPHDSFLLPVEVLRNLGPVSVNIDLGHAFSNAAYDRGWMGGLCVGRNVVKGWELDAEVHATTSETLDASESVLNFGSRIDLSEKATVLLAVGRDLHNSLAPRSSLLTYIGVQIRL